MKTFKQYLIESISSEANISQKSLNIAWRELSKLLTKYDTDSYILNRSYADYLGGAMHVLFSFKKLIKICDDLFVSKSLQIYPSDERGYRFHIEEHYKPEDGSQNLTFLYMLTGSTSLLSDILRKMQNTRPFDISDFLRQHQQSTKEAIVSRKIHRTVLNVLTPQERKIFLLKDPTLINDLKNPDKEEMEYIINNKPWILTDGGVKDWPEDLKERWSKIGKARKQIGL